jgi:hypothetical protein
MSKEVRTPSARKKTGVETTESRSVRAPILTWSRFDRRVAHNGHVRNRVLIELMEGYASGAFRLPTTKVETVRTYATSTIPTQSAPEDQASA